MSILLFIVVSLTASTILLLSAAGIYFYNLAILRWKRSFLKSSPDLEFDHLIKSMEAGGLWVEEQFPDEVQIKSYDGLTLRAYFLRAKAPSNKTAILAHGYSGQGKDMGDLAKFYYEMLGCNILLPDGRGQGQSEGNYIGFGWHDRKDYLKWIDYVIERVGKDSQIILHGVSMGGATVLMVSGENLPGNVKCIISDCAYTSTKDILSYQIRRLFKLPPFPLVPVTSLVCKLRAGYFFGEASAINQVGKTRKPVLFIHGEEDTFVPIKMVYNLYQECGGDKELYIVPGAGHGCAFIADPEGMSRKIREFVDKYTG